MGSVWFGVARVFVAHLLSQLQSTSFPPIHTELM
jgi:hypothetical protein